MAPIDEVLLAFFLWVVRASWHASILVGFVLLLQWALRRILTPQQRYGLWLLVLARLALPVSVESSVSIFNRSWIHTPQPIAKQTGAEIVTYQLYDDALPVPFLEPTIVSSTGSTPSPQPEKRSRAAVLPFIWLLGVVAFAGRVAWSSYYLAARLRGAAPTTDLALLRLVEECRTSMGVRQPLWIVETAEVKSPALFGLFVPKLLLPKGVITSFTAQELRFIFLHELTHVRRRDIALNWVVTGLQILHWFNPLAWFALSRLRSDREMSCDAKVLRQLPPEEARAYGNTILKLVDGFLPARPSPGLIGILEMNSRLRRRLTMIARFEKQAWRWSWIATTAALILAFVTLTDATTRSARPPVDAKLEGTQTNLVVRVVDVETGRAIPGATLGAKDITDDQGIVRVRTLFPITIDVRAEGYVPTKLTLLPRRSRPDPFVVRLDRAESVGGSVRDAVGRPIPDVEVHVTATRAGAVSSSGCVIKADVEGRWICTELPRSADGVLLRLLHPEYIEALYVAGSVPLPPTAAEQAVVAIEQLRARVAELVMHPGLTISGRVLDPYGHPIQGAEVTHGSTSSGLSTAKTVTGPDGHFRFRNGKLGTTNLTVRASGFVAASQTMVVLPHAKPLSFYLVRGRILRGRVVDEDGRSVPGAIVSGHTPMPWFQETGRDGSFVWNSAPTEPVQIRVTAPGYMSAGRPLRLQPGNREYEIRLLKPKAVTIAGDVFDAETKTPIPEFSVLLSASRFPDGWHSYWFATAGKHGSFSLVLKQPFPLYGVKIEADGYVPDTSHVVAPADNNRLAIGLSRGTGPSGMVRLPDGRPVQRARVLLAASRYPLVLRDSGDIAPNPEDTLTVDTDSVGRFSFKPLERAHTLLVSHELGFALVPVESEMVSHIVTLNPWGSVRGRLRIGSHPGVDKAVTLTELDSPPRRLALQRSTRTDAAGNFVFERVPPGRHVVSFRRELSNSAKTRATQVLAVNVAAGQTTTVQLGGRGRPLIGKIVFVGRKERIEWNSFYHTLETVSAPSGFLSFAVEFSPGGSYRIEDVPEGTYRLTLRIPMFPDPVIREVVVPEMAGRRSDLPLNLGTITIR